MIAHLQDGRYGDTRILGEQTARQMHSTLFKMDERVNGFAYGFFERDMNDQRVIGHGGSTLIFNGDLILLPEQKLGLFFSFNTYTSAGAVEPLVMNFMNHYFPAEPKALAVSAASVSSANELAGSYRLTRRSYTTAEKITGLLRTMELTLASDGALFLDVTQSRMLKGDAAFNVMGDWAAGYMATTLKLVPGEGFGYAPSPSTSGVFMMLSDSFGLPKGAKHREAALKWLRLLGSREGQDTFNPLKGSIAARLDSDLTKYNAYLQSAAKDWKSNKVVGSLAHGAVAPESFSSQFGTVMEIYLGGKNPKAGASAAQAIADQVGLGK